MEKKKIFPQKSLESWLKINPYELRAKGLKEKLTLEELGRIFYQISRHRGYRFGERNSKLMDNVLSNGVPSEGKIGYFKTNKQLKGRTLGAYLYSLFPEENKSYTRSKERIRNRVCTLEMYFKEVHQLWLFQSSFHFSLTDELRNQIIGHPEDIDPGGALFFQRPLKSQKHRVGNCLYESRKTRCCVSSLPYQELEAWKWVNTIRYNSQPLTIEDAKLVVHFVLSHYRFRFKEVKEILNLTNSTNFNYKDQDQFKGSFINTELSRDRYFGNEWFSMEEKKKEDIIHALYFFDSRQRLEESAQMKFGLNPRSARQFSKINIDKTYALLSRMATNKILYFLKRGHPYKTAVYLAGIRNAIHKQWNKLSFDQQEDIVKVAINMHREFPQQELILQLKHFFKNTLLFGEFNAERLYGFSKLTTHKQRFETLPTTKVVDSQILQLNNATLVQSVFELRKVLNGIVNQYGSIKSIACELSADLKVNRMQRFLHKIDQRRIHENAKIFIEELKKMEIDLVPMHVLKYELWLECKQTCPYSGNEIPLEMLFTEYVQIVYIHPWSRSLNDKRYNKTLCFSSFAAKLDNRTPYEYFSTEDPHVWEAVKVRASKLFSNTQHFPSSYKKFKRFIKKYNSRDIIKKQFNDGHQLSRNVGEFLGLIAEDVKMMPGNITSQLIDEYLLMTIFPNQKCENDYRENVLKAYVNAVCTAEHVNFLAARNKYVRQQVKRNIKPAHAQYLEQLRIKMGGLLVKHKKKINVVSKRTLFHKVNDVKSTSEGLSIRGLLHKDSLFGKRTSPDSLTAMHIRRPLKHIKSMAQVEKIVDPVIRDLVSKQLKTKAGEGRFISSDLLVGENVHGFPKAKINLPNKKGDIVPVFRVRMRESFSNPIQLKKEKNCYAVPRNNHHIMIYVDEAGTYREEVVSFWEVVQRYRKKQSIYRELGPEEGELITHLHINDTFLLGLEKVEENLSYYPKDILRKHLYRVQKLSTKYYEFRLANKQLTTSFEAPEYIRINNFGNKKTGWKTHNPVKVEVNIIGNIRLMKN